MYPKVGPKTYGSVGRFPLLRRQCLRTSIPKRVQFIFFTLLVFCIIVVIRRIPEFYFVGMDNLHLKWTSYNPNFNIPKLGQASFFVVYVYEAYCDGKEKERGDNLFKEYFMNVVALDKISLNRTLPDVRAAECKAQWFDNDLPAASVIVIFHNEWFSPLVRTVHSIMLRTAPDLLKEVILMDDSSSKPELGKTLEDHIARWNGTVKLYRSKERLGLIRARVEGAKHATGDVLVFLESHCEVTHGWLEPLLQRIKDKSTAVVMPKIDGIDNNDISYDTRNTEIRAIGGFWFSMFFRWIDPPNNVSTSPLVPANSPTMPGGLFAMDRKYFFHLGAYDEGMEIWGSENLEISFRIWMCGGSLEFIHCSHVGHIFRSGHPYNMTNKDVHGLNSVRLVEVWLDDYKRLYYNFRQTMKGADVGYLYGRHELRKRLQCKSFKWYLENIIPQKFVPDENVIAWGNVRATFKNSATTHGLCFDTMDRNEKSPINVTMFPCSTGRTSVQMFSVTPENTIRREDTTFSFTGKPGDKLLLIPFKDGESPKANMLFSVKQDGPIIHTQTALCLDHGGLKPLADVILNPCSPSSMSQDWHWEHMQG